VATLEKPKAVIVVGPREQDGEVELVQARGYRVLLFSTAIDLDQALRVDIPVEIDLNDEEKVVAQALSLGKRFDIRGVYTLNEYRVPLAARMAEALGIIHGLPSDAALNCRNKKRTRTCLKQHGVGSAHFAVIRSVEEARTALSGFTFPVIVKPSNDAGSNLVARCDSPAEVDAAVTAILETRTNWVGQRLDPEILLEEYLMGPEFSVESATANGRTVVLAVTAKRTTPPPLAVEVGHTVPAPLPATDVAKIEQLVSDALAALGVNNTVTHTEIKLTPAGPRIIEVNARPGGDRITVLVSLVTGYDLRELSLHLALGESLETAPRHPVVAQSAAIRFFTADKNGVVRLSDPATVEGEPGLNHLHLTVKDGDRVVQTTSNYGRLGHFIVHGMQEAHADLLCERVLERLNVRVQEEVLSV
jgi:S-sulfo-L-cysteine synthase (3-phospho-L-serine-dependent)